MASRTSWRTALRSALTMDFSSILKVTPERERSCRLVLADRRRLGLNLKKKRLEHLFLLSGWFSPTNMSNMFEEREFRGKQFISHLMLVFLVVRAFQFMGTFRV